MATVELRSRSTAHAATASFALAILIAAAATAQKREPMRGTVVTADGRPWADARIELLSRPLPGDDRFGDADELQTTSDAKGRFDAALLPGRRYLAWAWATLPDGRHVASHPVDDVCVGMPLELVADAPRAPATLQIAGLEPWRPIGPIACTLLSRTAVLLTRNLEERDGRIVLPAFPGWRASLELRCGERPLLAWPARVDLTQADVQRIRVQPPRAVRFRCVDAAGAPVAGAVFLAADLNGRHCRAEVARSDADGMLMPLLPMPDNFHWVNYPMQLQAPGRAPRAWIADLKVMPAHVAATSAPVHVFTLTDGRPLRSRLMLGSEPVVGARVRVACNMATADRSGGTHEGTLFVSLAPNGAFAVDVDPDHAAVVTAFVPAALLARVQAPVAEAGGFPLHPQVLLAAITASPDQPPLPETLDLDRLAALDVQVLTPDGAPAAAAQVGLALPTLAMQAALAATTDRSGRVRLLVPRGLQLHLCAWTSSASAMTAVEPGKGGPLRLQLAARPLIRGKVIDRNGTAVAHAEVRFFVGNDNGANAASLASCLANQICVRTDAQGRFALPVHPDLRYSLTSVLTAADEHYLTLEFQDGPDAPTELTVDLGKQR